MVEIQNGSKDPNVNLKRERVIDPKELPNMRPGRASWYDCEGCALSASEHQAKETGNTSKIIVGPDDGDKLG